MIDSLRAKEHLGFKDIDVCFKSGLVVFTGASGSGKSVFFSALLSVFGFCSNDALMIEATTDNMLNLDEFGIENEEINVFKTLKQKSIRYFLNSNQISQKNAKQISQNFISYLSLKDMNEFENDSIIDLIDLYIGKEDITHIRKVEDFNDIYLHFLQIKNSLLKIESEEKKIGELKEFAKFEIEKIESISPKVGEYEELMNIKKKLSKKDKILSALGEASTIFEYENAVNTALDLMDKKNELFDEMMNSLRVTFEEEKEKLDEFDENEIENVLDRIEKISALKNRFGSIEECLEHLQKRRDELARYENISFEKKELEREFFEIENRLNSSLEYLSAMRQKSIKPIEDRINSYLKELFLEKLSLHTNSCELNKNGNLEFSISLNNTDIKKISSGEYSRLRLAFIAFRNELKTDDGILVLDEVDSNLSGKESMSVANILKKISKNYQIFAISHHPQLSSVADQHFYVCKKNEESFIKELNEEERIEELSRMISGVEINEKAREFARDLRKNSI